MRIKSNWHKSRWIVDLPCILQSLNLMISNDKLFSQFYAHIYFQLTLNTIGPIHILTFEKTSPTYRKYRYEDVPFLLTYRLMLTSLRTYRPREFADTWMKYLIPLIGFNSPYRLTGM